MVFRGTRSDSVKAEALIFSIVTLILSLVLLYNFDSSTAEMQFLERVSWIPVFGIEYSLGLDGISLPLVLLTTFITILVILAAGKSIGDRLGFYLGAFLILEGVMVGVFAFGRCTILCFLGSNVDSNVSNIGIWGGSNRVYATIKFFLYTLLGSLLMLVALLYLYFVTGTFAIESMQSTPLSLLEQQLLFSRIFDGFRCKSTYVACAYLSDVM